jgi:hypothetical protein
MTKRFPMPGDGLLAADRARAAARMTRTLANNAGSDGRRQFLRACAAELELTARILEVEASVRPIQ